MAEASVTDLVDALNAHTKALNAFVSASGKGGSTESSGRSSSRASDKDDDKGETRTRSRSRASDKDDDKPARGGRSSSRDKGPTLDDVKKRFSAFLQDCDEDEVPVRTKWVKDLAYDFDKAERISAIDSKFYQEALDELDKEEAALKGDRRGGRDSAV
jgi:hypothetical protein